MQKSHKVYFVAAIGYILFVCGLSAFGLSLYINNKQVEEVEEISFEDNLKQSDADSIISIIETEGFHNAFTHYSSYRDISDSKFHYLRLQYISAANELHNYIQDSTGKDKELY